MGCGEGRRRGRTGILRAPAEGGLPALTPVHLEPEDGPVEFDVALQARRNQVDRTEPCGRIDRELTACAQARSTYLHEVSPVTPCQTAANCRISASLNFD